MTIHLRLIAVHFNFFFCSAIMFGHFVLVLSGITIIQAYQYCVIGAGPSGLQMGYFLQNSKRDYIIFERSDKAGKQVIVLVYETVI
jgi:hypothetical protein